MEEIILSKVCVLVTAAFLLTLVPGFRRPTVLFSRYEIGEPRYWYSCCSAFWKRPSSGKQAGLTSESSRIVRPVSLLVLWWG